MSGFVWKVIKETRRGSSDTVVPVGTKVIILASRAKIDGTCMVRIHKKPAYHIHTFVMPFDCLERTPEVNE